MMFDPPDYPYKDLSETYDDILLNKNTTDLTTTATEVNNNLDASNSVSFQSNDAGRYFNVDNEFCTDELNTNKESYIAHTAHSENLLTYEPTLLDEITVNQFLLPLQETPSTNDKEEQIIGPDLLALHSCVICHDIFTTESDLLNHTIAFHASMNILESEAPHDGNFGQIESSITEDGTHINSGFETDWLVCRICERVLSTALEVEPKVFPEQLCCVDLNGKCSVSTRLLQTMFVCDLCSGLFAGGEALDNHRLICYAQDNIYQDTATINPTEKVHYPEVSFGCDICGKQCFSTEELKTHMVICQKPSRGRRNRAYSAVNNNKMWNCGSCNQLFATARELYKHKRGEDRPAGAPVTAYVCEECDKVLGSMCALHTHKKMHKVLKPGYPCRICGRRFNQSGHLAIHMRMHTGERPYPCDLCPKAFKVKVERDDHRRTHTGERPFACAACPKTFTAAARLREHARIHTDQRPYRCDICGAAFRRPYARTVHTLIHTGEKPHECDVCGTAFRRSGDMWKHKRTLHGV